MSRKTGFKRVALQGVGLGVAGPVGTTGTISLTGATYFRTNSMPVGVGTPSYENGALVMEGQVSSVPRTPPLAGDKPQRYISLGTLGCRCSGDGGWCRRPVPSIPDRSPGHAFVPIAHAGWCRRTKV